MPSSSRSSKFAESLWQQLCLRLLFLGRHQPGCMISWLPNELVQKIAAKPQADPLVP